jgi:hypothetical protein
MTQTFRGPGATRQKEAVVKVGHTLDALLLVTVLTVIPPAVAADYLTFDGGSDRTLPGFCYASNARQGDFAGFQEGACVASPTGAETSKWFHVFPWDWNEGKDWHYIQIDTTKTAKGTSGSLKVTVTGKGAADPGGDPTVNGCKISSYEDLLANPSCVGAGTGGQPYVYFRRGGNQFTEATGANRMSLYLYVPPAWRERTVFDGPNQFDFQIVQNHCNPAENPCTSARGAISEGEPLNGAHGHFYHFVKTPRGGGWYHVLLDRHPQLLRNSPETPSDNPTAASATFGFKDYYDTLALFYIDGTARPLPTPYEVIIDEIRFYREIQAENVDTIKSVSVGYLSETDGTWSLGFNGDEGNPGGTWEIRYASAPITSATWATAIPVSVIGGQGVPGCPGCTRKQRMDAGFGSVVVNFDLPPHLEQPGARVFFAIKDVSQIGQHATASFGPDERTASNPNVHTIDFHVPSSLPVSPPAPPTGLEVR